MHALAAPRFTHYAADLQQTRHAHPHGSLCLVLSGRVRERVGRHEVQVGPGHWCHKPPGIEHATDFGPQGACLLQWRLPEGWPEAEALSWRWGAGAGLFACLAQAAGDGLDSLDGLDGRMNQELLRDALQLLDSRPLPARAPPWWPRALEALQEGGSSVEAVAADCGVHRAHLVRVAQAQTGASPAALRQRARLARSLARLRLEPDLGLAELACLEGYADQAHFSRACRRWLGLSPARWRRAAACAPSAAAR